MQRSQGSAWFARSGWMIYAVVAAAFLANGIVQVSAITDGEAGPATVAALVFSAIALTCAVIVGVALFRRRPTN